MDILIAVHHFPPKYTGGAEWRAFRTAKSLMTRGHQVRVVCIESITESGVEGIQFKEETYEGIEVRRLFFDLKTVPDPFRWKFNNPWVADQVRQMIRSEKPDIFHLFSGYLMTASALNAARDAGVPTILSVTDFWFFCPLINLIKTNGKICEGRFLPLHEKAVHCVQCVAEEKRRYRVLGAVFPKIMRTYWRIQKKRVQSMEDRILFLQESLGKVDTILCPSNSMRDYYKKAGLDEDRLLYSRQGVDLTSIHPAVPKPDSQSLRIGYVGQIAYHKGVHVLLEAVKSLPQADITLEVYGDLGSFPRYTRQLKEVADQDKRIHLAGTYLREEISSVFNCLDVLVMPSLWYENSPNVILEAFAYKLPVIASNLGGMAELIQNKENGYLFDVGNSTDLANKIKNLLDDPSILKSMAAQMPLVKSVQDEIDELEMVYQKTVENHALA